MHIHAARKRDFLLHVLVQLDLLYSPKYMENLQLYIYNLNKLFIYYAMH